VLVVVVAVTRFGEPSSSFLDEGLHTFGTGLTFQSKTSSALDIFGKYRVHSTVSA
jgi:hypothetical protein